MTEKAKIGSNLTKFVRLGDGILYKEVKKILNSDKVILQSDLFKQLKNNPKSLTKIAYTGKLKPTSPLYNYKISLLQVSFTCSTV